MAFELILVFRKDVNFLIITQQVEDFFDILKIQSK